MKEPKGQRVRKEDMELSVDESFDRTPRFFKVEISLPYSDETLADQVTHLMTQAGVFMASSCITHGPITFDVKLYDEGMLTSREYPKGATSTTLTAVVIQHLATRSIPIIGVAS